MGDSTGNVEPSPVSDTRRPGWLSDDEHATWRALVSLSRAIRHGVERQLLRDHDLPLTHYTIMVRLFEARDQTLRMSHLAAAANATQSQLSHAVKRLQEQGWVVRSRSENDGRGWNATLTESGADMLRKAAPGHARRVRELLFEPLTRDQQRQLRDIAETVERHMHKRPSDPEVN